MSARARIEQFGSAVGRLLLAGKIASNHYAAGRAWDRLAARYLAAIRAPSPSPPSVRLEPRAGPTQSEDLRSAVDQAIARRFSDALGALNLCGAGAVLAVRQICEGAGRYPNDYSELLRLRHGLEALARHWRLTSAP
jgi:hypothetical protein